MPKAAKYGLSALLGSMVGIALVGLLGVWGGALALSIGFGAGYITAKPRA